MQKIGFCDKFSLTQAVLDGTKTMTRRLENGLENLEEGNFYFNRATSEIYLYGEKGTIIERIKTRYKHGEVVAVAQSYEDIYHHGGPEYGSYELVNNYRRLHIRPWKDITQQAGWSNKMFVRPELMPHQIQITDINIERLQDISEEDCLKEGIQEYFPYIDRNPTDKVRTFRYFKEGKIRHCISPASKCFAYLIDDISGKGTWQSNPFVVVYEFKLEK